MPKKTLAVLGAGALVLVLGAGTASAQPGPSEMQAGRKSRMGRVEGLARVLGLSDQQKEQVQKLMDERRGDHQALWQKVEKNRQQLQEALASANPEPTAVGELAIEGHRLREQGRALRDAEDNAVRGLLTPDQQVKFDAMKALREQGPAGGRWMGHGAMAPFGGEGGR